MSGITGTTANKHITALTIKLLLPAFILFNILIACSTIKTNKQAYTYSTVTDKNIYQVRVRSGNLALDKAIHEAAAKEFGKYLQISGQDAFTGFIDITFISKAKRGITGSSPGYMNNVVYGNSWYTGDKAVNKGPGFSSSMSGSKSVGMFNLQKTNMTVVIKNINGLQFWNAQNEYSGISDFSRLFVQTADETAALSLERITNQFKIDFSIHETLSEVRSQIKPFDAALVIRDKNTFAPRIVLPAPINQIKPPDAAHVIKDKKTFTPRKMVPDRIKIIQEKSYLDF